MRLAHEVVREQRREARDEDGVVRPAFGCPPRAEVSGPVGGEGVEVEASYGVVGHVGHRDGTGAPPCVEFGRVGRESDREACAASGEDPDRWADAGAVAEREAGVPLGVREARVDHGEGARVDPGVDVGGHWPRDLDGRARRWRFARGCVPCARGEHDDEGDAAEASDHGASLSRRDAQTFRSRRRYCTASAMWASSMPSWSSRSAMVRASRRILS